MIALSPLDEARFGIRTAKVTDLSEACLPEALQFCEREGVRFLIARCPASDLPLVHRLEQTGFLLMDTLVYYRQVNLAGIPAIADPDGIVIRPVRPGEEMQVRSIAEQSFQGYMGHYHSDPRLDLKLCDEAYSDWAMRSCTSRELADEVLVAASADGLLGFLTLRLVAGEGEGPLIVRGSPRARARHRRRSCRSRDGMEPGSRGKGFHDFNSNHEPGGAEGLGSRRA